ncbi:MAG: DUF4062 domain-containing protein [Lachnospiraceae bacterium]|jgi:hypothetical protein|nr:DUF4062 domain-containing protein [Lachnospiraceae bacterium]
MAGRPWKIALISTDYDLKDERKEIIKLLEQYDVEVSAFEDPSFPVIDNIHSHDNCLEALKRADIGIVLINKRYGGRYYGGDGISITEHEYESLEVPTIVFVSKEVWNERAIYRKQQKESGFTEDEYEESGNYHPVYVDDVKVFRFIDRIQEEYKRNGKSNWINFWDGIDDLKIKVPKALGSRGVMLIRQIVGEQAKELKKRRTSTGLNMSLGDVFQKGYYIEPEYKILSGSLDGFESDNDAAVTLTKRINSALENKESCLVLGEAGVGKTTLMAKAFLDMTDMMRSQNLFVVPAYVWMKGMGTDSTFSVEEYLQNSFEKYLNKKYYPFLELNDFNFVFFVDGFDELAEKLTKDELERIGNSEIFEWPLMLTSREQYANRYIQGNDFVSKFNCCIKLNDWSQDTAKKYIKQFCVSAGMCEEFEKRILGLLVDNEDLHDVLKSPLLVTILVFVIERSRLQIPETIRSRTELFDNCLRLLAEREIETKCRYKITMVIQDSSELVLWWAYFAWMIYEGRLEGNSGVKIPNAIEKIETILGDQIKELPFTVYDVIFDTNADTAFGAFHEQFLEYLVAYALAYACLNKKKPYPEFLKYVMRPEINRYFRSIVSQMQDCNRRSILNNIKELYWNCMGKTNKDDILKRVHAVYHLSRLSDKDFGGEIDRIFNSEKEVAVLQSLYFGVIKHGDLKREEELYNLLNMNEEYNNSNRGYHQAYYDLGTSKLSLPYNDDVSVDWTGSLRAFQRHFLSQDKEHYYLYRIDLVTMQHFIKARGKNYPLTREVIDQIEEQITRYEGSEYQRLVIKEFEQLKELFEKWV